ESSARRVVCLGYAGLGREPQTPAREARGVGLALEQVLPAELGRGAAAGVRRDEDVVLLGRAARQRLAPVREVGRPALARPLLHGEGDGVGEGLVDGLALLDRGDE